jgi:hypothetical protein
MSHTEKPFKEIASMLEALQGSIAAAETRTMVNNTTANFAAATFMGAMQWILVDLSKAALEDRLLKRLVELQEEHKAIADHLGRSARATH